MANYAKRWTSKKGILCPYCGSKHYGDYLFGAQPSAKGTKYCYDCCRVSNPTLMTSIKRTRRLSLPNTFTILELRNWMLKHQPTTIAMNAAQVKHYCLLVKQKVPTALVFRGVAIKQYE